MSVQGNCHCGKVQWKMDPAPESVTACNCNICRRYGSLWAYGFEGIDIHCEGPTGHYEYGSKLSKYNFCTLCGCLMFYRANNLDKEGRRKFVLNFRMAKDLEQIAELPIDHFDGLDTFDDLPRDGRCVKDLWA